MPRHPPSRHITRIIRSTRATLIGPAPPRHHVSVWLRFGNDPGASATVVSPHEKYEKSFLMTTSTTESTAGEFLLPPELRSSAMAPRMVGLPRAASKSTPQQAANCTGTANTQTAKERAITPIRRAIVADPKGLAVRQGLESSSELLQTLSVGYSCFVLEEQRLQNGATWSLVTPALRKTTESGLTLWVPSQGQPLGWVMATTKDGIRKLAPPGAASQQQQQRQQRQQQQQQQRQQPARRKEQPARHRRQQAIEATAARAAAATAAAVAPTSTAEPCSICLSKGASARLWPCGHDFCTACATRWVSARGTCPLCRQAVRNILPRKRVGSCGFEDQYFVQPGMERRFGGG